MTKAGPDCLRSWACLLLFFVFAIPIRPTFTQSSPVRSQTTQPAPINLDFELGELGQVPFGWVYPVPKGYQAQLTEENPKSGKRAALLQSIAASDQGNSFGNLMQAFDATPFRGHRVRFRAAVRMEGGESMGRSQLWMRVDRPEGKTGFFDNMGDRPITAADWRYYEIVGDIDEDASVINIGIILLGSGKAWLDDASVIDLGKVVSRAEPARALTKTGLGNVVAFTRLLGLVRHFHPSDEAASTNWDTFAVRGMRTVETAKTSSELARTLEALFKPIAPTVRVFPTPRKAQRPNTFIVGSGDTAKFVSWRHVGFGQKASQQALYRSERIYVPSTNTSATDKSPRPWKPFKTRLAGGVSCEVPLALYSFADGTTPRGAASTTLDIVMEKYSGNDRATRLADVALAWNVLQHFYPYFDVVKSDWHKALKDALASAATDTNERAFLDTLRRMVVELHDGHGGVYHSSEASFQAVPVIFGWVEGQLIITDIADTGTEGLQPGDIVLKVDGKPSAMALTEREYLISGATPQWRRYRSLSDLRTGPKDSELRLEVRGKNGQLRSVILKRTINPQALTETKPPKVSELKPGIFYLDLDRINDADFQAVLPQLENATGIIFDLRGYPSVSPVVISHLTDKPVESARWNVPIVTAPDFSNVTEYVTEGRWKLEPISPRLKAKLAFITDGRAISYAESYMGIIEAYKLAEIVGEPTAGTNGNINPIVLPGNYRLIWTGMKVLKHDGSRHHGVGIQPTVPVSRTIRGVAEKRDEQLERAIAVVSR